MHVTDSPPGVQTDPYRWVILCLLSAAYVLVFVQRLCPAVLSDAMAEDLQTSGTLTGLLASAYFYTYASMQLPGGVLSDRLGTRRLVSAALLTAGLGGVLFALAPNVPTAFAGRLAVGLGLALILVPTTRALTFWFSPRDFVMASSAVIACGGLGGLLAGTPMALAVNAMGWRMTMLGVAGITLGLSMLIWLLVRDTPGTPAARAGAESPATTKSPTITETAPRPETEPARQALTRIAGNHNMWLLALWFFVNGGVTFSFTGLWAGPYFMQVYGMDRATAGSLISLFGLGMWLGPLCGGVLGRLWRSRRPLLAAGMFGPGLLFAWGIARNGAMGMTELSLWALLLAFNFAAPVGILFTAAKERFPAAMAGTVSGFVYVFPMVGSALFQPLMGLLLDTGTGGALTAAQFQSVFTFYIAACLLAGAGILFLREPPLSRAA